MNGCLELGKMTENGSRMGKRTRNLPGVSVKEKIKFDAALKTCNANAEKTRLSGYEFWGEHILPDESRNRMKGRQDR